MIILFSILLGAVFGWLRASRRGGDRNDKLHYAGVNALLFGVVGVVLALIVGALA